MQGPSIASILDRLQDAAFFVQDHKVTYINAAAAQYQIPVGTNIREFIGAGSQEYESFRSGKLYLQLNILGTPCATHVTCFQDGHIFCILSDYTSNELRALALVASHLGDPIQDALSGIDQVSRRLSDSIDQQARDGIGQVNRSLYQLVRSVRNMTDASALLSRRSDNFEHLNATAHLAEFAKKLQSLAADTKRVFTFTGLKKPVYTMLDPYLLERAFFNMVNNAIKFSPEDSTILTKISTFGNQLHITIENASLPPSVPATQLFERYLREPGIEERRFGIGLGLAVVRNIAIAHYGTLLISYKNKKTISCTLSIAIREDSSNVLRSSHSMKVDYSGGLDPILVELSDVLPDSMYENI